MAPRHHLVFHSEIYRVLALEGQVDLLISKVVILVVILRVKVREPLAASFDLVEAYTSIDIW